MGVTAHKVLTAMALLCFIINTRGIAACIAAERDALVAFNASINDPRGRFMISSWQGENCCNWSGVRCRKKTGHVVQLDLGEYSLKGELDPSLAGLTNLVYLNLSHSDFGGASIPEFIGSFKMLRYLDLSHAGFGGTVPPDLGNLSSLTYLDLSSSGSHVITMNFHWVSKLTSLRYLDLSWLYLAASSDWLQAVNMLPLLQVLHLNDASLPATDLNYLPRVNFTTLTELDLKNNNLHSSFPSWIWNLSVLSELDMSSCGLSGRIPDDLGQLTSLKFVGLADNKLEGAIPRSASRLCKLVYLDLSRNLLSGHITEVANILLPCMKLQFLSLNDNKLTGNLSGWLEQMGSLRVLDLSKNSLSGAVPGSMGKLSNLKYLDVSFNSFEGTLSEHHFSNLSRLDTLILASNSLKVVTKHSWVPPFQLRELGLHACFVGPEFPSWLQSQSRIEMIDLGSAGINDPLPDWIWNFSSSITSLNVSTNNVTGKLPTSLEQMKMLTSLNMRYNLLEGSIPDLPACIQVLDLSHNQLSGSLPQSFGNKELYFLLLSHNFLTGVIPTDLCNIVSMQVIDLSNNNLSGELPNCWHKNSNLYIIDFSSNKFWGEIPSTIGSLSSLVTLHLNKNNLSGMLPTSLQSSNMLMYLDLGENNLSGNIPKWIGTGLQTLVILSLGSNQFSGAIPEELSQLHALQYLDVGNNKLSGPLSSSLGNLTAMRSGTPVWYTSPFLEFMVYGVGGAYFSVYMNTLEVTFKGYRLNFMTCYRIKGIDLSENQLTGEIPSEIGFLSGVQILNLSRNHIGGSIPDELGSMTSLESLDLSWNDLSGPIPQSLTSLVWLSDLKLAYNNLLGQIPSEHQFSTFDGDSYLGNVNLCGSPLPRICLPNNRNHFDMMTYLCMMLGFACGFSIICVILISSGSARKAYFQSTDRVLDKLRAVTQVKLHTSRILAGRDLSVSTGNQNSVTCYHFEGPSTATQSNIAALTCFFG